MEFLKGTGITDGQFWVAIFLLWVILVTALSNIGNKRQR